LSGAASRLRLKTFKLCHKVKVASSQHLLQCDAGTQGCFMFEKSCGKRAATKERGEGNAEEEMICS
jgi:hypothetical protein